jgi:hypothetical protein
MNAMNLDHAPNLETIELNGRIVELLELNNALAQRCANMRGQMALKDTEISRLIRELTQSRAREEERKFEEEQKTKPKVNGSEPLGGQYS